MMFTHADAHRAYEEWGANCGPGALAAIAGLTLDELRPLMGDFEAKGYTNPTLMLESMARVGLKWSVSRDLSWPRFGLARVQWGGPWMKEGVAVRARYRHTHWVSARRSPADGDIEVFDINAMEQGGWIGLDLWRASLVPWLIKHAVPRGDGNWSLTHVFEVVRK